MQKRTLVILAVVASTWLQAQTVRAHDINPAADAYVAVTTPTTNYGSRPDLRVKGGADAMTSYLAFDLAGLSGTVEQATLRLRVTSLKRTGTIAVQAVAANWSESTITANNGPLLVHTPVGSGTLGAGATELVIDLTGLVQGWVDDPSTNLGLALVSTGGRAFFSSREGAHAPLLAVELDTPTELVARDDIYQMRTSDVLTDDVLADNGNGPDVSGIPPTQALLVTTPAHGTLTWEGDGGFVYEPGEVGQDQFTYQLVDAHGDTSNVATVTIGVTEGGALPNILLFVADDIGWGDLPANNPNAAIPMPALDQLAAEGMRFTDAHTAAAKCAPTRYSIVTGNYHWRGRFEWGQWNYRGGSQILEGQRTLADLLRQAGYATAIVGKSHLGGDFYIKNRQTFASVTTAETSIDFGRAYRDGPTEQGFDYSFNLLRGMQGSPYAYFENDKMTGSPSKLKHWAAGKYGASKIQYPGIGMPYYDSSKVGPDLVQAAIRFIDQHHAHNVATGDDRPFFLYYASQSRHAPYTPPASLLGTPVRWTTGLGSLGDMIYEVDVAFGKLLGALEARALDGNTLVIFTSDNGGTDQLASNGHDSNPGLRGNKGDVWEGGHRVPFVVRLDNVVAPGSVSSALIAAPDIVATITSLVGVDLGADQARDSFDFTPVLLGNAASVRDELVIEGATEDDQIHRFGLRSGDWKLLFDPAGQPVELYDLATDLGELDNRIGDPAQADRVTQMVARFGELRAADRTAP